MECIALLDGHLEAVDSHLGRSVQNVALGTMADAMSLGKGC